MRVTVSTAGQTAHADYTVAAPTPAPLVGVDWSTASPPEPNYYTDWPAVRVYRFSHAANAVAAWGSRIVAVTDDPAISATGGQAAATALRAALEAFYYGSGSAARKDVGYHFGVRNEIDREYTTGSLPQAVIDTHRLCREAIDTINGDGSRRYPNASLWVDMTFWQIKTAGAGARFSVLAPYLHGFACSLYNPGREQVPVVWTPYSEYVDLMLDTAKSWGLNRFSIWETGSPVASNPATRPAYFTGLLDAVTGGCATRAMTPELYLYWNRQTTGSPPGPANQFKHDRSLAPNDTATVWHNWTP